MARLQRIYLLPVLLVFLHFGVWAQPTAQEAELLVSRMYYFNQHLTWASYPGDHFTIGYFTEDASLLPYLQKLARSKRMQGKKTQVLEIKSIDDLADADLQMLYVNQRNSRKLLEIKAATEGKNTLLLSHEAKEKTQVMINFLPWKGGLGFEIHKNNVQARQIEPGPNLLVIGGKEIDVRELYLESSKSLKSEKEKVEQQEQLIANQLREMERQKEQIAQQTKSIIAQQTQLAQQNAELLAQQQQMKIQKQELENLLIAISQQQEKFAAKQEEIRAKEKEVAEQQSRVDRYNNILAGLRKDIELNQSVIAKQQDNLQEKELVISTQSDRILGILFVLGITVALVIMAVVAYIGKRRANRLLQEKNNLIERQNAEIQQRNEEVMAQRDELAAQNIEIQQQKEEIESQKDELLRQKEIVEHQHSMIKGSIRYAQTIQTAILPPLAQIRKSFDNFVIFRPKDMVSGDFYWHSRIVGPDSTESYFAVVDCTGHGVPGAFMSMIGSRLLNLMINERQMKDPAMILEKLDRGVSDSLRQDENENRDGMEVCLVKIIERNGQRSLEYAGARIPLYIYQHQSREIIKFVGSARGIAGPLKKSKQMAFSTAKIAVEPNDVLYLTTDGFKDQNDRQRRRFGSQAMTLLLQNIGHLPMPDQAHTIEKVLDSHMQGEEQRDDITMAGIRI